MIVQIRNWEKYNPRKDTKRTSWFRLEHDILTSPDFYSFTGDEFKAFIYLFCEQSRSQGKPYSVNFDHAERSSNVKNKALRNVIKKLLQIQFIIVSGTDAYADVTDTYADVTDAYATNVRTNVRTNERLQVAGVAASQLAKLWNEKSNPILPKVHNPEKLPKKWAEIANARLSVEPNLAVWEQAIVKTNKSDFLTGRTPSKERPNWKADFEFLIREETLTKLLGGKYDNRRSSYESFEAKSNAPPKLTDEEAKRNVEKVRSLRENLIKQKTIKPEEITE